MKFGYRLTQFCSCQQASAVTKFIIQKVILVNLHVLANSDFAWTVCQLQLPIVCNWLWFILSSAKTFFSSSVTGVLVEFNLFSNFALKICRCGVFFGNLFRTALQLLYVCQGFSTPNIALFPFIHSFLCNFPAKNLADFKLCTKNHLL